ncbi:MAG: glycosyltransferase family 2 protein [Desulfatitalea sp.]|nr:glycosyltransferase family 2 protein [Desulfatitalea sp.]
MDVPIWVSVIIPVKDEARNILPLADELVEAFYDLPRRWEIIWVDDGSGDGTLDLLKRLALADSRHRFISFDRNHGQSAAVYAGFCAARGTIIATMDGDGQNDPADLPKLVAVISDGRADMVNGYRQRRQDNAVRKLSSKVANAYRALMTGRTVRDSGCATRAFHRDCVQHLPQFKGLHRFLPTLVSMRGYKVTEMPVNHRPRTRGQSKYAIFDRLWVGIIDCFGVLWLRKRGFEYTIAATGVSKAEDQPSAGREGGNEYDRAATLVPSCLPE